MRVCLCFHFTVGRKLSRLITTRHNTFLSCNYLSPRFTATQRVSITVRETAARNKMSVNRNGSKYITDRRRSTVFDAITGAVLTKEFIFLMRNIYKI